MTDQKHTSNGERLEYSVREVFKDFLENNGRQRYRIPDYQRGYKWTPENATKLLDDVDKFRATLNETGNEGKFYCLQNITLCEALGEAGEKVYNVVDGQQRLTTLVVILSYLGEKELVDGKLEYAIRTDTHRFIKKYIQEGTIFSEKPEIKRKDQYYLYAVSQAVSGWFAGKSPEEKDAFTEVLLNNVELIVNTPEGEEERTFANLNGAKVPLDGADLIRAILMTHAAKERYHGEATDSQINELRVRMGMEIDQMGAVWGNDEFSAFFSQMIPEGTAKQAAEAGFNTKSFPLNLLYILFYEKCRTKLPEEKQPKAFSFDFFEYGVDLDGKPGNDNWELYAELRKFHLEMQDWFADRAVYHYLGYLFFQHKGQTKFSDVYREWEQAGSKEVFRNSLRRRIVASLAEAYLPKSEREKTEADLNDYEILRNMCEEIADTKQDWYDNRVLLAHNLVLLDVIAATTNASKTISRLPAAFFTVNKEDIEHIGCQTPNENDINDPGKWEEYVRAFKENDKEKGKEVEKKWKAVNEDPTSPKWKKFVEELNQAGLNSIGNLALLNLSVNRGYRNASYSQKRRDILYNFYEGKFIRTHTLQVFAKVKTDNPDMSRWTFADIKANAAHIAETIRKWVDETGEKKEETKDKNQND